MNKSFTRVRNAVAHLNALYRNIFRACRWCRLLPLRKGKGQIHAYQPGNTGRPISAPFLPIRSSFHWWNWYRHYRSGLLVWWAAQEALLLPGSQADKVAGVITSFILCINLLFRPLRMMADKFNVLQMGMIAGSAYFPCWITRILLKTRGSYRPVRMRGILSSGACGLPIISLILY